MELILATQNCHKVRELRNFFSSINPCDFYSLLDFPDYDPLQTVGESFEENAKAKAVNAAKKLGKWVLADDSGLVVPALGGEPGIFSSRYAGSNATEKENRQKLLREMQDLEGVGRFAYFACYLALARPDGTLARLVSGYCEGVISNTEKGRAGFGYDNLFIKHDYHQTFAELDESIKNRISHRAKAVSKLMLYLESGALK